jgi:hypothetical protein
MSVHLGSEPERLPVFLDAVARGELAPGYAVDDGAALVFAGTELHECVASRPGARVLAVQRLGDCDASQRPLEARLLDPVPAASEGGHGVSELRALRAGRRRWD